MIMIEQRVIHLVPSALSGNAAKLQLDDARHFLARHCLLVESHRLEPPLQVSFGTVFLQLAFLSQRPTIPQQTRMMDAVVFVYADTVSERSHHHPCRQAEALGQLWGIVMEQQC